MPTIASTPSARCSRAASSIAYVLPTPAAAPKNTFSFPRRCARLLRLDAGQERLGVWPAGTPTLCSARGPPGFQSYRRPACVHRAVGSHGGLDAVPGMSVVGVVSARTRCDADGASPASNRTRARPRSSRGSVRKVPTPNRRPRWLRSAATRSTASPVQLPPRGLSLGRPPASMKRAGDVNVPPNWRRSASVKTMSTGTLDAPRLWTAVLMSR